MKDSAESIWENRQMSQIELNTFTLGKENILDYPIDKLIESLKVQSRDANSKHDQWIRVQEYDAAMFAKLEEQINQTGHSLHSQMHRYVQDLIYIEDELFSLFEMKIIYAFKHLEINIKQLLFLAYQDKYINRQFK